MLKGVDYIGVGVGAVILSSDKKIFLAQRGVKAKNERGHWSVPGGGVDWGERRVAAAVREVQEEHACLVEVVREIGTIDHIIPDESQHWITTMFLCKLVQGEPLINEPEKCVAIGWFDLTEVTSLPLASYMYTLLDLLREQYPNGLPDLPK